MHEKFLFILERKSEKSRAPQCLAPFASQTPIGDTKRAKRPRNSGGVAPGAGGEADPAVARLDGGAPGA
jgi:hypothetical protein